MSVARNGSHLSNRPAKLRPTLLSPPPPLLLSIGAPLNGYLKSTQSYTETISRQAPIDLFMCCGRQQEPAILIYRLLLRMRRMYAASIRLDFH